MLNIKKFWTGIRIVAKAVLSSDTKGELEVDDSSGKLNYHNGSTRSPIVTESHSATIINKTIDADDNTILDLEVDNLKAGVLNTSTTLAGATDAQIPSALATKTYIDDKTAAQNDASEITFTPSGTISATNVQAAIEELDGDIQGHITDATDAHDASAISITSIPTIAATDVQGALTELQSDISTVGSDLGAHIVDAVDAHDASAISNIPSGNLAATDVQSALNELQSDIDTRVTSSTTSIDNHIARFDGTTGKIIQDGSTAVLSDAGALSGLTQLDVDNIRLDGNTISTTDTNGNLTLAPNGTGLVTTSNTVDLNGLIQFASTNDTASGSNATLTTPTTKVIRLTNAALVSIDGIPGGVDAREVIIENATGVIISINNDTGATTANRIYTGTGSTLLLAVNASIALSYDSTSSRWRIIGGSGSGSSGGGLDIYYSQNFETLANISTFSTGNNATFLGGGSLQGTLAIDTSAPIAGTKSLKYTQAAGSLNDYFASDIISIDLKERSNDSGMTLYFEYNGNDNDMKFVVYDVTNSQILSSAAAFVKSAGKATRYSLSFFVPSNCTQIRWGAQVLVANNGKILYIDDVEFSTDPFMEGDLIQMTDWQSYTPTFQGFGTPTSVEFQYRRVGSNVEIEGKFVSGTSTAVEARIGLPTGLTSAGTGTIASLKQVGTSFSGTSANVTYQNAAQILVEPSVTYLTVQAHSTLSLSKINGNTLISSGNTFTFFASVPIQGWSASTPHVLTPVDTFSTDTAALVYAGSATYTLSTLANAPVGTFITFTYAANTNTRTQTTTAPTQTTADMNANGIQLFTRAYNAASTAASPAVVAIQIGKGLKGVTKLLYKSTGKVTPGTLDTDNISSTAQIGAYIKSYSENTGVLLIDAGYAVLNTNTGSSFIFEDTTTAASGYLVINASKSAALTAVPTPLTVYLKDVKTSGTAGGTATSGSYQTRTLNTVEGDTSFVTLSSNQFTLSAGIYEIEAIAPAGIVSEHKAKLFNVTTSSDQILGSASYTSSSDLTQTISSIVGRVMLSQSNTFEIRHRVAVTRSSNGFGLNSSFGDSEVYTQVKIKKVG